MTFDLTSIQFAPSTVLQLYEVDYQVRGYIAATLKKQVAELGKSTDTETASQKATFRLALCYAVGFGVDKNDEQSKHLLDRSNKQDRELKDWVDQLRDTSGYILQDDKLRRIIDEGAVNFIDYANCYREHDRLQQFEKQCAREIADTMATLHDTHIIARILKRILATVLRDQGQWNKAENLMREVIAMEEKELGPEDSVKLQSLANLSHILHKQGRLKESTELQVRVKEGSENIFGPKHLRALVSSIGLASLYRSQSKWKEAEKLQTQVKERQKEKLGDDHPSTLNTMLYLAGTYQLKGRFMEAEEMFVEIQKKSRKALGDEHDFTLTTKINLSIVYFELGRYQEAEKEQIEVLSVRKEKLGAEHPETLTTMNNLASTYSKMKPLRLEEAKEIEQEIVAVRKRKYGVKNVETLITSNNLAYTYLELGKKMEALKMQKETASAFLEESGISHVNTINALNNYVATLQLLDKSARVDKILLKLLDAMKAISEDESLPITLSINDNLAHAYRSQHRYGEAIGKFKKTYALRSQRLGEGHPDTVASKHYLNETQTSLSMTNVPAVNQPSDNQFLMELEELEREIDIQLKENMRKSKGDGIYAIGECSPD